IARLDGDTGAAAQIFVNGCALGVGCALSTPASQFRIESFSAPAPRAAGVDPPVLSPLPPPVDGDERETEAVTTGAGNEEIGGRVERCAGPWRGPPFSRRRWGRPRRPRP